MILKKSNQVIEAFMQLSRVQQRILCIAVNDYINNTYYASNFDQIFKVNDLKKSIKLESGKEYKKIKDEIQRMKDKKIVQRFSKNKFYLFSKCEYIDGKGSFRLCFSDEMKKCLKDVRKGYTLLDINYLLNLKSIYSVRLYEILKQYEKLKIRKIHINDLKFLLGVDEKYSRYYNLKKRAIEPALNDINKTTDIHVEFKEVKNGKCVEYLVFDIEKNKNDVEGRYIPRSYLDAHEEDLEIETSINRNDSTTNSFISQEDDICVCEIARMFPTYIDMESAKDATSKLLSKYSEDIVRRNVKYSTRRVKIASRYLFYLKNALVNDWAGQETPKEYLSQQEQDLLKKFESMIE